MDNPPTLYADLILPLAVEGLFTYQVPEGISIKPGSLVVVPLGKFKQRTGLVFQVHQNKPQGYQVKEILYHQGEALGNEDSLVFWQWMWEYYLCTPGEIVSAALPGRLKLESESVVRFSPLAEKTFSVMEDPYEQQIMAEIRDSQQVKLDDLQKRFPKNFNRIIRKLIEQDLIILKESIHEPDPQFFHEVIRPTLNWEEHLHQILQQKKAPKQREAAEVLYELLSKSDEALLLHNFTKKFGFTRSTIKALVDKKIIQVEEVERGKLVTQEKQKDLHPLSAAQKNAWQNIRQGFENNKVQFLHGVTSSGKTEIYAHLIQEQIKLGKQCLFLVPEIALTTQLIQRMRVFFGDQLSVYHSRMSEKERSDVWESVRQNLQGAKIIIGARSAIFLPFADLGLIVVDEEHDASYKQTDPAPRYQGRDAAIMLGRIFKAQVLLGSATPSLETYHNCTLDRYDYHPLTERYGNIALPKVEIVDFGWERKKKLTREDFSLYLLDAIKKELQQQRQVIVFHNRRGHSPITICRDCGHTPMCINCDVSLTYHKFSHSMRCHICGFREQVESACTKCGSVDMQMRGAGTEKIVDQLQEYFPEANIDRLDWDSTRKRDAFEQVIGRFERGETQILVGTQMVTKGLDFKNVGLVGIVQADIMMNIPEIRATERTYQMCMQVAGRAGRFGEQGKVIIQTYTPDSAVIQSVASGKQKSFYRSEIADRKLFDYPPYTKMIRVSMRHRDFQIVEHSASCFKPILEHEPYLSLLGPEAPLIARAKNQYRMDILIKLRKDKNYEKLKRRLYILTKHFFNHKPHSQVRVYFDVDPG